MFDSSQYSAPDITIHQPLVGAGSVGGIGGMGTGGGGEGAGGGGGLKTQGALLAHIVHPKSVTEPSVDHTIDSPVRTSTFTGAIAPVYRVPLIVT